MATGVLRGVGGGMGGGCLLAIYVPILVLAVVDVIHVASDPSDILPAGWVIFVVLLTLAVGLPIVAWLVVKRRRGVTVPFRVEVAAHEVARGGRVDARLVVEPGAEAPGRLEVGLVCTVWYDEWRRHHDPGGTSDRMRVVADAVAFEAWQPLSALPGSQAVRFDVPPDAPFSHEGEVVSFSWRVAAREAGGGKRGPSAYEPVWVTP